MNIIQKYGKYIPIAILVFIFVQSMPFKFGIIEGPTTPFIFASVGDYLGLPFYSEYGGAITGLLEIIAVAFLIMPKTRFIGAVMAFGILAGAIFFHLTAIGIPVPVDIPCPTDPSAAIEKLNGYCVEWDPSLFAMAVVGALLAAYTAKVNRPQVDDMENEAS